MHAAMQAWAAHIAAVGLVSVLPSAISFSMFVYASSTERDTAVGLIKVSQFMHEGKAIQLACFPFGAFGPDQAEAWWITGSYGDNVELVAEAVVSLVKSKVGSVKYKNRVTVRQVLRYGVFYGSYIASFSSPPPWCGKKLPASGGFRLITAIGPGTCRFFRDRGHTMENCQDPGQYAIDHLFSSRRIRAVRPITDDNNGMEDQGEEKSEPSDSETKRKRTG